MKLCDRGSERVNSKGREKNRRRSFQKMLQKKKFQTFDSRVDVNRALCYQTIRLNTLKYANTLTHAHTVVYEKFGPSSNIL